jgi:hypothetical protein
LNWVFACGLRSNMPNIWLQVQQTALANMVPSHRCRYRSIASCLLGDDNMLVLCFAKKIAHFNLHLLKYTPYCWQPDHLLDDADFAAKKIGSERAERSSYTFRSLLAGGAQLAFGSDWPVRNSADFLNNWSLFFCYHIVSMLLLSCRLQISTPYRRFKPQCPASLLDGRPPGSLRNDYPSTSHWKRKPLCRLTFFGIYCNIFLRF